MALPFGFAAPADAFCLDAAHYRQGLFRGAEADEDLIEHHIVQHGVAGGAEGVGEAAGVAAGTFDERGHAGAALGADGGPEFDAAGAPDRWSARGPSWFLLPALSLGILAIFALIAWSIGPLARGAPGLVNVPRKDLFMRLPPAARERALVPTRAYLVWVVSLVAWLFVWILEGSARVAVGQAATLSSWPVFVFLALVLTTLVPLYAATSRVMKDAASREDTP